ncbi:hypothetical protein [Demequina sp.]|uniref:hypothetical protein n=1 Tax=Demequina sp. TaxID=2050685 RepID=UPI003D0BA6EE
MAQWDPETGKVRPVWTIRFSAWWIFVGCAIAAVVTTIVLLLTLVTGSADDQLNDSGSVFQGAIFLLGIVFAVFVLVGPALAWGLGFMLRNNENQGMHVLAFALLGAVVGFLIGNFVGLGTVVAPAAGIGAAVGRWAISSQAKI